MLVGSHVCFDCMQIREDGSNLVVMSLNIDKIECVHKILQTGLQTGFTNRLQQNTLGGTQVQRSNTKKLQKNIQKN